MTNPICSVKRKLDNAIQQLCSVSWMFVKNPLQDFTRNRKLPFRTVISILLSMEGRSLNSELLSFFGCLSNILSASAFIQQRAKISKEEFSSWLTALPSLTLSSLPTGALGLQSFGPHQEKNWKFLIRVKDTHSSGITASLDLPPHGEFDRLFSPALTKRQTNDVKNLLLDKNSCKFLPACVRFDFLSSINHRHDPRPLVCCFFTPKRWGTFSRKSSPGLIIYNFTELVVLSVVIQHTSKKYSWAVHVCRQFFLGSAAPPDIDAILRRFISSCSVCPMFPSQCDT